MNWLTGLHCPGCGTQRALHALLHGRMRAAAGHNLLAALCTPLLLLGAAEEIRSSLRNTPRRLTLLYRPWLGWAVVGATVVFTLLRNLPGPLHTWLAP
ncbi:DUF2752 domain-containing protein [Hymenobacter metallilatus]|uniref:DUF2752 domain-containing protein n=1 Tax=Hymenobacter metallilatus TaxID=2493666 RepID=UPI00163B205E|nr:DUF2752 domain-containing protein [Hymenobacter metallilatus]